jgi:hypothetical protein
MIADEEPVADLPAIAVDRQRLALKRKNDGERDQLLGKLVGSIVVGAVGDRDW